MNLSSECFKDPVLRRWIEQNGKSGRCDICGSSNVKVVHASALEIVFKPLLDLYEQFRGSTWDHLDSHAGNTLFHCIQEEDGWNTFSDKIPGFTGANGHDFTRFREKARVFLREHQDHLAVHKLRMNQPLTQTDLQALESMLARSGVGTPEQIEQARKEAEGLGIFVRSLIGLDREAAKQAFAKFLGGKTLNSTQIEFIDMIINHLTEHGVIKPDLLYASPFTDLTPHGPDGLFPTSDVDAIISLLTEINNRAVA